MKFKNLMYALIAVATIVGWTLGITAYFTKKSDYTDGLIVQMEMIRMVATAPHGGDCENSPQEVRSICKMLDIITDDLKRN